MIIKPILFVAILVANANSKTSESDSQPEVPPVGTPDVTEIQEKKGFSSRIEYELIKVQVELHELKTENDEQDESIQNLRSALFSHPTTCANIDDKDPASGTYFISPEENTPAFPVFCDFTHNETETIIYHNFPNEVEAAEDCEAQRCAKYNVVYDVTIPQIAALIEQSAECRQFIKYRCIHSVLFRNDDPTFATWLSRDGTPQIYWGGATSQRDRYCACGETGSCVQSNVKCNCDENTSSENSDEGFLTDKNKLPVTGLQFGDLSKINNVDERGWFTLGPLICTGRAG